MAERSGLVKPPAADSPLLGEIVRRLVEAYQPWRIYLFGSAARGEAGADSDYDLAVVMPDTAPQSLRREETGYRSLRGTGVAVDLVVMTRSAFESQLHLKASLPAAVVEEGILLYAG